MSLSKESRFFAVVAAALAAGLTVSLVFNFLPRYSDSAPAVPETEPITAAAIEVIPQEPPLSVVSSSYWKWDNSISLRFNSPVAASEFTSHLVCDPETYLGLPAYPDGYASEFYEFQPDFLPDSMYRVTLKGGMTDSNGTMVMEKDYNMNIVTSPVSPKLNILSSGRIFPPSGEIWSLPFSYEKLEKVTFELFEGYANNQGTSATQSCYMSRKITEKEITLPEVTDGEKGYFDLDLDLLLPEREPGFYILRTSAPNLWSNTYPLTVSDIGISGAFADEKVIISLHSLADGTPVAGASVQLISNKKQELAEGETDENGNVTLWYDLSADPDDYPELIKAFYLNDCNTLPCAYFSNSINLSDFDLSGAAETDTPLRAKVHPVRDLIRPGETVKTVILLRDGVTGNAPGIQPAGVVVLDTNGNVLQRELLECTENGFASFDFSLPAGSLQGEYMICAGQPGSELQNCYGSASILAADFKPDTVRIDLDDTDDAISGYAGYFFGQAAADIAVNVRFVNNFKRFAPAGFPGYVFGTDPGNLSLNHPAVSGVTTAEGRFSFIIPPAETNISPVNAVLYQTATATVLPGSSRPVSATKTITRHLDRSYLGTLVSVAAPEQLKVEWLSIDGNTDAIPMECDRLEWQLERLEWEYVFVKTYGDKIRREWIQRRYPAGNGIADIDPGASGGSFTIPCPSMENNFLLTVTDPVTGMQCIREVALLNEDAGIRSGNRMVLPFVSDAVQYAPGDVALITFELDSPSSVTVISTADAEENIFEFKGTAGTNIFEYTIPEDTVSGAVRLAFTVLTPDPDGKEEMRRSFGIASLNIDQSARAITVEAEIPAETTPGTRLNIPVKTGKGAGTEIRAWAINSGTLALTGLEKTEFFKHFHGPRENVWAFFDCYSDLYPQFSLAGSSEPGGDSMLKAMKNLAGINQKPEDHGDIISLPAITDEEGNCTIILDVPETESCEYTLFVAAGNSDSIGETVGKFIVRKQFSPVLALPRAAAGGDTFEAVLELFNHKSADPEITWEITYDGPVTLVSGEVSGEMTTAAGTSAQHTLLFKANDNGDGICTFTAKAANSESAAEVTKTVQIRPAVLPETRFVAVTAAPGETVDIKGGAEDLATVFQTTLTAGSGPGTNLGSRLEWLNDYPYGCSEQLISVALPQLAVAPMIKLGILPEMFAPGAIDSINNTIATLRSRQNSSGGIRMWDGDETASPDASVYCGFFLAAAQEKGIKLPENMLNNLCSYLEGFVLNSSGTSTLERRALAGVVIAKNGGKCIPLLRSMAYEAKDAGNQQFAMAVCGYALYAAGNGEDGLRFFREGLRSKPWVSDSEDSCWSSKVRRMGILLAAGTEMIPGDDLVLQLAQELENISLADSATTQEMAWSAYALAGYAVNNGSSEAAFSVTGNGKTEKFAAGEQTIITLDGEESVQICNDGPGLLTITGLARGISTNMEETASGIKLTRRFIDSNGNDVTEVNRGDLFTMELTLTSLTQKYHDDIVVAALLPGGVEAEDARFVTRDKNGTTRNTAPRRSELLADRAVIFDAAVSSGTVIHISVRATSKGVFAIPAAVAEDMYDPSTKAVVPAGGTPLTVK